MAQIRDPNEIWSMPKYKRLSLTQNQPMRRPATAAKMGPAMKPTHVGKEVFVRKRANV
jgi:hypothetical protein